MVATKKAIEDEIQIKKVWDFLEKININYNNISLYILAFVHRSIVNERPDFAPEHNERLEFLWDAVLELAVTSNLFLDYKNKPEWELTDIRSAIVRGRNLANIAKKLELNNYLLLWKWEEKWGWRNNDYILANTVESLIWAIYSDIWYEEAKKFIDTHIYSTITEILNNNLIKDFKTSIQEFTQAKFDITPSYEVLFEEWLDHEKKFTVGIFLWNKQVGTWIWTSKKKAQEEAAHDAYIKLKNN